jgi:hypothetical protein
MAVSRLTDLHGAPRDPRRVRVASSLVVVTALLAVAPAFADDKGLYERLWPHAPDARRLTLSEQIQEQLTELGNTLGYHLDLLSHEMIGLEIDARRRRAYVRVSAGDERFLTFKLASDIHFTEGLARVHTRVDLRFRGRALELELPEVEMVPASYRGERGVELRLPLFRRRF